MTATSAQGSSVAGLEHQIKLLLERIRVSQQERIDPNQLLLFSVAELKEMADQLNQPSDDDLIDDEPPKSRKRRRMRVRKRKTRMTLGNGLSSNLGVTATWACLAILIWVLRSTLPLAYGRRIYGKFPHKWPVSIRIPLPMAATFSIMI